MIEDTKPVRSEIEQRIKDLADAHDGRLTPELLIAEAKSSDSPLHQEFEWDDSIAAHRYRIDQARELIRSVRYVFRTEHIKVTTVAYVRDPEASPSDAGYISVDRVKHNEDMQRDVLISEFKRAADALSRARKLAALFGMTSEIDGFIRELDLAKIRVAQACLS